MTDPAAGVPARSLSAAWRQAGTTSATRQHQPTTGMTLSYRSIEKTALMARSPLLSTLARVTQSHQGCDFPFRLEGVDLMVDPFDHRRSARRREDTRFVTSRGANLDDLPFTGLAYAVVWRVVQDPAVATTGDRPGALCR